MGDGVYGDWCRVLHRKPSCNELSMSWELEIFRTILLLVAGWCLYNLGWTNSKIDHINKLMIDGKEFMKLTEEQQFGYMKAHHDILDNLEAKGCGYCDDPSNHKFGGLVECKKNR